MALTRFFTIVVTFADTPTRYTPGPELVHGIFHIREERAGGTRRFTLHDGAEPVALSATQQCELAARLDAMDPAPDPGEALSGADGAWYTLIVERGGAQQTYRWWGRAPAGWESLQAVVETVMALHHQRRAAQTEPYRQRLARFADSLIACDPAGIVAPYHPEIRYHSALFDLRGAQVGAMWRMLCHAPYALRATRPDPRIHADERGGSLYWEAHYTVPATGRRVQHAVRSTFTFADDTIIQQSDAFNFRHWTQLALGPVGTLLGNAPLFRRWVAARAQRQLVASMRARDA